MSAAFLLMLGLVGLASSIYSLSYLKLHEGEYGLREFSANYPLFIALMYAVLVVRDLFWFLIFWELMTLSSQFLVSLEYRRGRAVRAGFTYFTLTKGLAEFMITGGVMMMIIAASAASGSALSTSFGSVAKALHELQLTNPVVTDVASALFFLGLMVKVSLVPSHVWLPEAYPEAPSNVSALLSGAMIKIGVYMMFRLFLFLLRPDLLWGIVTSVLGALTLTYCTMMALKQVDSKRLLAYHSCGQIGYVVLGLGACITLLSTSPPHPVLAAVAAFASLYHAFNHSVFKSLLFFNAGSVEYVTHSRNLNLLGGLGKLMPLTALTALIASFSISGIPPFNGFVSKWLIYASTMTVRGFLPILGFLAMFISSVTTASFIKFYTSLFGRPSRRLWGGVEEVPPSMLVAQLMLAVACVVLGVLPGIAWSVMRPVVAELGLPVAGVSAGVAGLSVPSIASNYPALIAATLFPLTGVAVALLSGRGVHGVRGWACGASVPPQATSPPAKSYYEVFEEEFSAVYRVGEALHEHIVVKGSRILRRLLGGVEWFGESPSPMSALAALALAAALLTLVAAYLAGC